MTKLSPQETIRRMFTSYYISQSVYVFAKLKIADVIGNNTVPVEDLARALQCDTHSLYRVLRLLDGAGVVLECSNKKFTLTELGQHLKSDSPDSMRTAAVLFGEEPFRSAADLLHTVKTGETALNHHYGMGHFEYLSRNPEQARTFHDAMTQLTRVVARAVVSKYDFGRFNRLVDVGAGQGLLLIEILKSNPHLEGVLFEASHALPGAREIVKQNNLNDRCEIVEGDFFESVNAEGDVFLLKSVIHDWDDKRSIQILRNCRKAMKTGQTLILVERIIPLDREIIFPRINDVVMMVVSGGCERTEAEYHNLYNESGFEMTKVIDTGSGFSVIEGRAI